MDTEEGPQEEDMVAVEEAVATLLMEEVDAEEDLVQDRWRLQEKPNFIWLDQRHLTWLRMQSRRS